MRIVLVNDSPDMRGGENQTLELGLRLRRRGIETAYAVRSGSALAAALPEDEVRVEMRFEKIPLFTPVRLRRFFRDWGPDIVHAQTSRAHTHALIACRGIAPLVVSRRAAFAGRLSPFTAYKYGRGVAHFIPISEAAARSLISRGVPRDRMSVVHSGVDLDRFSHTGGDSRLRSGLAAGEDVLLAGTAAALEEEKGHRVLLEAASVLKERGVRVAFALAGEGRLEPEISGMIERRGLDARILGRGDDLPLEDFLCALDIYILPSLEEGLSTGLIAAMAAGLPCVASRTGGIPEVTGGEAALLFEPGDAGGLAAAVERLARDPGLRGELARRARDRSREFGVEDMVDGTIEVYKKVLHVV